MRSCCGALADGPNATAAPCQDALHVTGSRPKHKSAESPVIPIHSLPLPAKHEGRRLGHQRAEDNEGVRADVRRSNDDFGSFRKSQSAGRRQGRSDVTSLPRSVKVPSNTKRNKSTVRNPIQVSRQPCVLSFTSVLIVYKPEAHLDRFFPFIVGEHSRHSEMQEQRGSSGSKQINYNSGQARFAQLGIARCIFEQLGG